MLLRIKTIIHQLSIVSKPLKANSVFVDENGLLPGSIVENGPTVGWVTVLMCGPLVTIQSSVMVNHYGLYSYV